MRASLRFCVLTALGALCGSSFSAPAQADPIAINGGAFAQVVQFPNWSSGSQRDFADGTITDGQYSIEALASLVYFDPDLPDSGTNPGATARVAMNELNGQLRGSASISIIPTDENPGSPGQPFPTWGGFVVGELQALDRLTFDGPSGDLSFRWTVDLTSQTGFDNLRGECTDLLFPINGPSKAVARSTFGINDVFTPLATLTNSYCENLGGASDQTASGIITVSAGSSTMFTFSLVLGATLYAQYPDVQFASVFVNANNTASFYIDPLTPGASYRSDSGNSYLSPTVDPTPVPEPATLALLAPIALYLLRVRRKQARERGY